MDYPWNWRVFFEPSPDGQGTYLETLISGLGWTIAISMTAWMAALAIGILVGVLRTLPSRPVAVVASAWIDLFRNIPVLVQVFLWYFVVPELLPAAWGTAMKQMVPPWGSFVPAAIGLSLFTSARVAEQVRAGLQALPKGQALAAVSLGLSLPQRYRLVLLPQALRIVLPPLTSEFMNCIKNSSVALTIGLVEVTAAARSMQEFTFQAFEAFAAATVIYVALNVVVVLGMRRLERRVAIPGLS